MNSDILKKYRQYKIAKFFNKKHTDELFDYLIPIFSNCKDSFKYHTGEIAFINNNYSEIIFLLFQKRESIRLNYKDFYFNLQKKYYLTEYEISQLSSIILKNTLNIKIKYVYSFNE